MEETRRRDIPGRIGSHGSFFEDFSVLSNLHGGASIRGQGSYQLGSQLILLLGAATLEDQTQSFGSYVLHQVPTFTIHQSLIKYDCYCNQY